jgi:hypothetical protein
MLGTGNSKARLSSCGIFGHLISTTFSQLEGRPACTQFHTKQASQLVSIIIQKLFADELFHHGPSVYYRLRDIARDIGR